MSSEQVRQYGAQFPPSRNLQAFIEAVLECKKAYVEDARQVPLTLIICPSEAGLLGPARMNELRKAVQLTLIEDHCVKARNAFRLK